MNRHNEGRSFFDYMAIICAFACFSPMLYFLWVALSNSSQLRDVVVILVSSLLVLAIEFKIRPRAPKFSKSVVSLLIASYIFFFFGNFIVKTHFNILATYLSPWVWYLIFMFAMFAGFSLFLASLGRLFFSSRRYVYALSGGVFSFSIISILLQFADLPLRIWAGRVAGYVLAVFGENVSLLVYKGELPQIALNVSGKSYLVATECNGFGIISSCLVVSIIIAIFRRGVGVFSRGGIVLMGVAIGFIANVLRIVSIIVVSLLIGNEHYYIYHEALGYVFFALALVVVWFIALRFRKSPFSCEDKN